MKSYPMWICAALVSFGLGWHLMAPSSFYELEQEPSVESRSQRYLKDWKSVLGPSVETIKIRYAYPDIRLHQIDILTAGGQQRLITFVSQQPALHLPALALISHARTGFLASEASAFLDEELAVQLGASLSYFGLHGEVPSRGSRRYRAIQVHRGILDPPKSAFSSLDWFLETTRLGGDYFRSMVASEHADIAVDILNALPADSLAHEVLSITLGANTYRAIGRSMFISGEGTGHLRHDQMPDAAAAVAFTEWIDESRAESSQWLLENVDSNTNQHLIEALIERIRVDDRDSAMAWSMLLSDESKKAHYEQSLQIYDDSN